MFKRVFAPVAAAVATQARCLSVHEFQGKKLLQEYGAKTEYGIHCTSIEEAQAAISKIKTDKKVVKSQILAGGRGKGHFVDGFQGGVHVCKNAEDALDCAKHMLHNKLITKQTAGKGIEVRNLFVTEAVSGIKKEMYVALVLDRQTCCPTFIGSAEGGMGIEELAKNCPEKIMKYPVNIHEGIKEAEALKFASGLGLSGAAAEDCVKNLTAMYNLAKTKDCTMVEINPMVECDAGVLCIDCKLSFDDSAHFRRPEIWALEDLTEKDPKEIKAAKFDLNYIALDGSVGCMVNGAGLAMATMDVISHSGSKPANFLDVGGSAATPQIVAAVEIITADPSVKAILINIFGGIMRCDIIAEGVVEAVKQIGDKLKVPIVCRLKGTNETIGKKILKDSGMKIYPADSLDHGAQIAADLVNGKM